MRTTTNTSSSSGIRRGLAFTIVELLVVIGIIAVLVALLLPALNRARTRANNVVCLNNLRQLGTAAIEYGSTYSRIPALAMYIGDNSTLDPGFGRWNTSQPKSIFGPITICKGVNNAGQHMPINAPAYYGAYTSVSGGVMTNSGGDNVWPAWDSFLLDLAPSGPMFTCPVQAGRDFAGATPGTIHSAIKGTTVNTNRSYTCNCGYGWDQPSDPRYQRYFVFAANIGQRMSKISPGTWLFADCQPHLVGAPNESEHGFVWAAYGNYCCENTNFFCDGAGNHCLKPGGNNNFCFADGHCETVFVSTDIRFTPNPGKSNWDVGYKTVNGVTIPYGAWSATGN